MIASARFAVLLGLPEFDIYFPDTVEEACSLLSGYDGGEAKVLAGGTDLLVSMKHRKAVPRYLINIKRVPDLNHIRYDHSDGLRIGALTTIESIKDSSVIGKKFAFLSQAASKLGTTQVRNLGTLGGNLANASPSAEFAPALLTLEASVRCVGSGGERSVPVEEFFVSPGKSILRQDELLTEVHAPNPPSHAKGIYLKHSFREMDVSMAGAAVFLLLDGDICRDIRIALGAVAPVPFRARKAEQTLRGQRLDGEHTENELLEEVARAASNESSPIDDLRAYAAYRREVVWRMVRRGLEQVIAQARQDQERTPA